MCNKQLLKTACKTIHNRLVTPAVMAVDRTMVQMPTVPQAKIPVMLDQKLYVVQYWVHFNTTQGNDIVPADFTDAQLKEHL